MNLRPVRFLPILIVGLAAPLLVPTPAPGQPIDDLREQADQLTTQIEENGAKVAALGEQLNVAQIKVDEAQAKITDAQAQIDAAEARIDELRVLIAERAAAIYRTAITSDPLGAVNTEETSDAAARSKYTDVATARDDALVDELAAAKSDLERERATAEDARQAAQRERDELAAAKAAADAAAADQEGLLAQVNGSLPRVGPPASGVEGDIAGLVAEEQARRQAALATAPPKPNSVPKSSGPPPLGNGGAGAAVGYAWAQVGKPYCYGGTGPGCFDCSGLTQGAWAAGGVSLPRTSGAQAGATTPISTSDLQPGDLITSSSWGAHIGIWVGGGYIHATHTGDFIKFVPGAGSVVDARRV